jgi:hypothetical protein
MPVPVLISVRRAVRTRLSYRISPILPARKESQAALSAKITSWAASWRCRYSISSILGSMAQDAFAVDKL